MATKRKAKFRVGQVVRMGDAYGKVEGMEYHDGWFYVVTISAFARTEDELRPLTARERGK